MWSPSFGDGFGRWHRTLGAEFPGLDGRQSLAVWLRRCRGIGYTSCRVVQPGSAWTLGTPEVGPECLVLLKEDDRAK